ncbi:MAG: alcohol dehydrogenase catalytic domain-containing protein [Chloroflexi bacterium]|nr:alcohol dehydrogenase catalytic domain-containing protein [Chloroflexota bacterium]
MRAAFLVGPSQLQVRETAEPVTPEDGLVLEVRACGVCGSDLRRWREGPASPKPQRESGTTPFAVIPGHEIGGIVISTGRSVSAFREGDWLAVAPDVHCGRCFYCQRGLYNLCDDLLMIGITPGCPGGLAERLALTGRMLRDGIVHRLPQGVSFEEGALAEPLSSVVACHQSLGTGLADTVVVIGAGPIGCMHIAVAKARGARVIVSQRSEPRRTLAARFGPDLIVDPGSEDLATAVRDLTDGRGAEIAICANPVAETQRLAVELVRKGGRVVLFGGLPKAEPMVTLDANRIHYGEIQIWGAFSYHPTMHELALDLLARKMVRAEDLITHRFALDDVQAAFETAGSGVGLKTMVLPQ